MMKTISVLYQNREGEYLADNYQPLLSGGGEICEHNSTRYINVSESRALRPLPELYQYKELCCGCSACLTVCPKSSFTTDQVIKYRFLNTTDRVEYFSYTGAISMLPDEEGFLYPVVDANKCIGCYKCMNVCPYKRN